MKRIMPLNLIVLALLVGQSLVANSVRALPALPLAVSVSDTIRQTDTIYVHVPLAITDTVYVDTIVYPEVHDTVYFNPDVFDLQVAVDTSTPYGKVSGSGSFPEGTDVEVAAIANRGYRFVRWDDGNTDNPRVVTVDNPLTLVAFFDSIVPTAKDGSRPESADTVILRDTVFVYVYDTVYSTIYDTLRITPHDTLFLDTTVYYQMLVLSGDEGRGVVAGNGTFPAGTVVEIAAVPLQGYRFVHWHDNNRDNPRRVMMDDVQIFVADFTLDTGSVVDPDPDPEPWDAVLKYRASGLTVTVTSPASARIRIFTPEGRLVVVSEPTGDRLTEAVRSFRLPQDGIYLVQVGAFPVRKFVLMGD